jgi:hypothetical protein
MRSSVRILVASLAVACQAALAQTAVPPTLTVQRLAPQLVAFAGSQANFQSLVTGLAQGTAVQLVTVLPDGSTQVVTFTPAAAMAPDAIAQLLETARQQLIGLGIGNPTAEQIGFTLMGGVVPTALGGSQVTGVLNPRNPPSPAAQIQSGAAAGATASPAVQVSPVTSGVNVQLFPSNLPVTPTSAVTAPRNTSDSRSVPLTSATPPATTPTPAPGAAASAPPGADRVAPGSPPPTAERPPPGTPRVRN